MLLSIDVGQKNLGICVVEETGNIHTWNVCDLSKDKLVVSLVNVLENYTDNITECIIEKQPNRNLKMRVIEGMILMFYTLKQIKVSSYSAKYKLKQVSNLYLKGKHNYRERKKQAILITTNLLENKPWLEFFKTHKKKDDLADSYLQALSYLNIELPKFDFDNKKEIVQYNSRKPTLRQKKYGYSICNIKYVLLNTKKETWEHDKKLLQGINKYFKGNVQNALDELNIKIP